MPPRAPTFNGQGNDHDLLIRIDTRLEVLNTSVTQNHNDMSVRLSELDKAKVDRKELEGLRSLIDTQQSDSKDLAEKVDWTRRTLWMAAGGLTALNIIIPLIITLLMRK